MKVCKFLLVFQCHKRRRFRSGHCGQPWRVRERVGWLEDMQAVLCRQGLRLVHGTLQQGAGVVQRLQTRQHLPIALDSAHHIGRPDGNYGKLQRIRPHAEQRRCILIAIEHGEYRRYGGWSRAKLSGHQLYQRLSQLPLLSINRRSLGNKH